MPKDLNKIAEQLRRQQSMGVDRNGQLVPANPHNDGTKEHPSGNTTLEPKRFFM
ncbi:MAG: hypothetical protein JEZ12_28260 [Desulfobacterium sp.]|nr:hypothetical protein [Desulfobacterium sp.]